jgi:hypothetical protein
MRNLDELEVVFDAGYDVTIQRMYQPILDGLLIISEILSRRNRKLTITHWGFLAFQLKVWGFSANEMNSLWRDISKALETVDKHWTVVYTESTVECSYEIEKVL